MQQRFLPHTLHWVWAPPGSFATTTGIFSFPRGTLDVSVPPVPPAVQKRSVTCLQVGLPHSDSLGSQVASTSPRHFAAWPRPSSAVCAKASTMCSSLTMSSLLSVLFVFVMVRAVIPQYRLHARRSGQPTFGSQGSKINTPTKRWSRGDSNPGPPPCKGGALPAKLRPHLSPSDIPPRGWARLDSNQGPRPYQGRALTT